jgi:hypothetical protein
MKKSGLTNYALLDFNKVMKSENFKSFKTDLELLQNKNENLTDSDFAKLLNESPEFEIMQKYFIRTTLSSIESQIKTIKIIIVIFFIASILAGIIIGLSS